MPRATLCLAVCLTVLACAPAPEIAAIPVSSGAAPKLVPLDGLLAQDTASSLSPDLTARAASLKARAALMRGPVMDPATRDRLAAALANGGT